MEGIEVTVDSPSWMIDFMKQIVYLKLVFRITKHLEMKLAEYSISSGLQQLQ